MRKYEVMVLIDSEVDERLVPALVDKHLEVITKGGGTVDNTDHWGRRRLAYDINKKSEAIYAVLQITAEPAIGPSVPSGSTSRATPCATSTSASPKA